MTIFELFKVSLNGSYSLIFLNFKRRKIVVQGSGNAFKLKLLTVLIGMDLFQLLFPRLTRLEIISLERRTLFSADSTILGSLCYLLMTMVWDGMMLSWLTDVLQ
jgi:hypothetical protein